LKAKFISVSIVGVFLASLSSAAGPGPERATAWKAVGPPGGNLTALAVLPSNENTVLCGTYSGGIYRTTNGGGAWQAVGRTVVDPGIRGFAFVPASPGTVYVGTAHGIYRTTNGGATWTSASGTLLGQRAILSVAIHPTSPKTVFAGSAGHGIYKTTNAGATWTWLSNELSSLDVYRLEIDPSNPKVMYACVGGDAGVYKSANGGASWKSLGRSGYPYGFAIDPVDSRILYFLGNGFWKSADGGKTWTALNPPAWTLALAHDPKKSGVLYVGTYSAGIYKSLDGGATWTAINTGLTGLEVRQIAVARSSSSTVFIGTQVDGIFRSRTGGAGWVSASKGLNAMDVRRIAFDGQTAGVFYAACSPGLYKATGGGTKWTSVAPSNARVGEIRTVVVHPKNHLIVYMTNTTIGVWRSDDAGQTWKSLGLESKMIVGLTLDPAQPDRIFVPVWDKGVYRSQNAGKTWANIGLKAKKPGQVVFDPSSPGSVYAATEDGVWRGTATGTTWTAAGMQDRVIYNLTIDANGVLYAGTGGEGAYKSMNHGASWTAINTGLPSCRFIDAFTVNPKNTRDLYAGVSDLGVYRSKDGGASWSYFGGGLCPKVMVFSLVFDPKDQASLYAGTSGAGVYKVQPGN